MITQIILVVIISLNVQFSYQQYEGCCIQSAYLQNIDYFGNDLPGSPYQVKSPDECCSLCQQTETCQAWTFVCDPNPACSQCYLKSCVGSDIRCNSTRISGVKQIVPLFITTSQKIQPKPNLLCSLFKIC